MYMRTIKYQSHLEQNLGHYTREITVCAGRPAVTLERYTLQKHPTA